MPPEIHRASPAAGQPNMVDKLGEKSFSAMQGLMVAEDRKLKEKDVNSFQSVSIYKSFTKFSNAKKKCCYQLRHRGQL